MNTGDERTFFSGDEKEIQIQIQEIAVIVRTGFRREWDGYKVQALRRTPSHSACLLPSLEYITSAIVPPLL